MVATGLHFRNQAMPGAVRFGEPTSPDAGRRKATQGDGYLSSQAHQAISGNIQIPLEVVGLIDGLPSDVYLCAGSGERRRDQDGSVHE